MTAADLAVYEAGAKAGAAAMAGPAAQAGVQAGALFGGKYVLANTVVHRRIERDAHGRITGVLQERVPTEQLEAAE